MSAPRSIIPGITYLLTRRCARRRFLLRPSPRTNQVFRFCLAVAAERAGVLIHAYCVLSNHYHIVATDPNGNLPVFMHWLNEYVAKCMNAELGLWESFWAPGSYSALTLNGPDTVMDRMVYTYTNPVSAGLVQTHLEWPGARSLLVEVDGPDQVIERPEGFFRDNGPVAETAVLRLVSPPCLEDDSSQWKPVLQGQVEARELEIREDLARRGLRFLGRRKVLRQSPRSRPRSTEPRRGLNPRVAAVDKWKRIEALQRLKGFLSQYREAWLAFTAGDHQVEFPFGTYNMWIRFAVPVSGPPN